MTTPRPRPQSGDVIQIRACNVTAGDEVSRGARGPWRHVNDVSRTNGGTRMLFDTDHGRMHPSPGRAMYLRIP